MLLIVFLLAGQTKRVQNAYITMLILSLQCAELIIDTSVLCRISFTLFTPFFWLNDVTSLLMIVFTASTRKELDTLNVIFAIYVTFL